MGMSRAEQEKRWQAESDARTLQEAEKIRNTPSRLKSAKKELTQQAKYIENAVKAPAKTPKKK